MLRWLDVWEALSFSELTELGWNGGYRRAELTHGLQQKTKTQPWLMGLFYLVLNYPYVNWFLLFTQKLIKHQCIPCCTPGR